MDEIEKYVYNWVFSKSKQEIDVDLVKRLQQMPKEKDANKKFKELNNKVEKVLAEKGANNAKVPLIIRGFNIFLFILSIIIIIRHVLFNGFQWYNIELGNEFFPILFGIIIILFALSPLIMGILYVPVNLIVMFKHKVNKTVQRITGQKVATTTISIIILFSIVIIVTAIFAPQKYIVADEILICVATILILTDNLMLKNNVSMIEDYSKLNTLKKKIEKYSLLKEKDIEQVTLWENYLSYAVSFGISGKIIRRIKGLDLDDDLISIVEDKHFNHFIKDEYYEFYRDASLDTRFMNTYKDKLNNFSESLGSGSGDYDGGYSSGGRRRLLRRRRFFWWRRLTEVAGGAF